MFFFLSQFVDTHKEKNNGKEIQNKNLIEMLFINKNYFDIFSMGLAFQ